MGLRKGHGSTAIRRGVNRRSAGRVRGVAQDPRRYPPRIQVGQVVHRGVPEKFLDTHALAVCLSDKGGPCEVGQLDGGVVHGVAVGSGGLPYSPSELARGAVLDELPSVVVPNL